MKVTFDFGRQQIGIEGDGPELADLLGLVRDIAPKLPSINIVTNGPPAATDTGLPTNGHRTEGNSAVCAQTLRQFVKCLPLDNAYEKITAIAYYQTHSMGRSSYSPKELSDWFTQAGLKKPAQMGVALADCRRRYGYMESASRGEWRITTNGENLIVGKMDQGVPNTED